VDETSSTYPRASIQSFMLVVVAAGRQATETKTIILAG
jgi:hypothetical protein